MQTVIAKSLIDNLNFKTYPFFQTLEFELLSKTELL